MVQSRNNKSTTLICLLCQVHLPAPVAASGIPPVYWCTAHYVEMLLKAEVPLVHSAFRMSGFTPSQVGTTSTRISVSVKRRKHTRTTLEPDQGVSRTTLEPEQEVSGLFPHRAYLHLNPFWPLTAFPSFGRAYWLCSAHACLK